MMMAIIRQEAQADVMFCVDLRLDLMQTSEGEDSIYLMRSISKLRVLTLWQAIRIFVLSIVNAITSAS